MLTIVHPLLTHCCLVRNRWIIFLLSNFSSNSNNMLKIKWMAIINWRDIQISNDIDKMYINGLVQDYSNSTALAMELLQWSTKPLTCKTYCCTTRAWNFKADSRFAPSQWETLLQSNAVSHWLSANLESALEFVSSETVHMYIPFQSM